MTKITPALIADALEIADSAARSDIECNCDSTDCGDPKRWYDVGSFDPADDWAKAAIPQAVRYLEARGLIERHPERAELVRMVDGAKAC